MNSVFTFKRFVCRRLDAKRRAALYVALLGSMLGAAALAAAQSTPPFAELKPDYFVDETKLPFDALPGTCTQRYWGLQAQGAAYQMEVPCDWDGRLVLWVHGSQNSGEPQNELTIVPVVPVLRQYYVTHGVAWAASSFAKNLYDIKAGAQATHQLGELFKGMIGEPTRVYLVGISMGSHIIAVMLEQWPTKYSGAAMGCGVLGDYEAFDYYLDINLVAQALAGVQAQFPEPDNYHTEIVPFVKSVLWSSFPQVVTPAGAQLEAVVQQLSGGTRPFFGSAFRFWADFFFTRGYGDGTRHVAVANAMDNVETVYQMDGDPDLTPAEKALNDLVLRVGSTPQGRKNNGLANVPPIAGSISVPVLIINGIGDLQVPFSMAQIYVRRVAEHGKSDLLVSRAIRSIPHCGINPAESLETWLALEKWVEQGTRPEGDDILDPVAVADPKFGCKFTRATRAGIPSCQ